MSSESVLRFGRPLRGLRSDEAAPSGADAARVSSVEELQLADRRKQLGQRSRELARREQVVVGREAQLSEKERDLDLKLEELGGLIESVQQEKAEILKANEEEIVSLSLSITEKVLQHEVEHGRYKIGEIVKSALEAARQKGAVVVRVNPRDLAATREAIERLAQPHEESRISAVPDESISLASCCIEAESGRVFSEIPARLRKIEQSLLKRNGDSDGL